MPLSPLWSPPSMAASARLPRRHPQRRGSGVRWRKSSFSGYTECVELADTRRGVRDTKDPHGPVLVADVDRLLAAVKRGDLRR